MCGRIVQKSGPDDYVETIRWNPRQLSADPLGPRYNVPPGTRPLVMHQLGDEPTLERVFWGFAPVWYKRSPVSNARIDTILDPKKLFWRGPIEYGRMIVPADGWYEWTKEGDGKVPWFIHPKDGKPIMMAAVSGWRPGAEADKEHGMAIVTDDSAGGMVDIHDRRPVALSPGDAQEWADPATPVSRAKEIMAAGRPESAFVWYRVTTKMNSARYQLPDAIDPICPLLKHGYTVFLYSLFHAAASPHAQRAEGLSRALLKLTRRLGTARRDPPPAGLAHRDRGSP